MSEVEFKVGDLVYCPTINNKISKITKENEEGDIFLNNAGWFKNTGLNHNDMPVICLATQEKYELLSKLYPNVTFEPPPKRKEPIDVVIAMLEGGHEEVCLKAPMIGHEIVGNPTHDRNAFHAVKRFKPYCLKKVNISLILLTVNAF